jgi:hypothetical protein
MLLEAALLDPLETTNENKPHEIHELVDPEEVELVPVLSQDDECELEPFEEVLLVALDVCHLLGEFGLLRCGVAVPQT